MSYSFSSSQSDNMPISPALWKKLNNIADKQYFGIPLVDKAIDYTITKAYHKAKLHFGVEMRLVCSQYAITTLDQLYDWLASKSKKINKILNSVRKRKGDDSFGPITNTSAYIKLNSRTYMIVLIGQPYRDMVSNSNATSLMLSGDIRIGDFDMYIYIFGKSAIKYQRLIYKIIKGKQTNSLRTYKISGDVNPNADVAFKSLYQDIDRRDLDTIFMEDGVIDEILDHIDKYISNKDVYSGRGIIYKTGILLYGEPGTGKTSLIKALACKYDYDLVLLDMVSFDRMDLETLTHSIEVDDKKYIIALEDIDCVIADRENKDIDKDDKKIVNKLLQLLDSNSSPNNVIFIASTNHIELLDDALLREGRFDLKCHIGGIHKKSAIAMCKSFNLPDNAIAKVLAEAEGLVGSLETNTIRQSKLQTIILKYSGLNLKGAEEDEDNKTSNSGDIHAGEKNKI